MPTIKYIIYHFIYGFYQLLTPTEYWCTRSIFGRSLLLFLVVVNNYPFCSLELLQNKN